MLVVMFAVSLMKSCINEMICIYHGKGLRYLVLNSGFSGESFKLNNGDRELIDTEHFCPRNPKLIELLMFI